PSVLGLAFAFGGMRLILAPKLGGGSHALLGDALGLGTACFYAAYILAVARLRGRYGTGIVMFASTLVFTLILLPLALLQKFLPATAAGWWVLLGCATTPAALRRSARRSSREPRTTASRDDARRRSRDDRCGARPPRADGSSAARSARWSMRRAAPRRPQGLRSDRR